MSIYRRKRNTRNKIDRCHKPGLTVKFKQFRRRWLLYLKGDDLEVFFFFITHRSPVKPPPKKKDPKVEIVGSVDGPEMG